MRRNGRHGVTIFEYLLVAGVVAAIVIAIAQGVFRTRVDGLLNSAVNQIPASFSP